MCVPLVGRNYEVGFSVPIVYGINYYLRTCVPIVSRNCRVRFYVLIVCGNYRVRFSFPTMYGNYQLSYCQSFYSLWKLSC